jgi:hypothetical protein
MATIVSHPRIQDPLLLRQTRQAFFSARCRDIAAGLPLLPFSPTLLETERKGRPTWASNRFLLGDAEARIKGYCALMAEKLIGNLR